MIVVAFLASVTEVVYNQSVNQSKNYRTENLSASPSPNPPSPTPAETVTPSPTPNSTLPSDPVALGSLGYYESFWISSPTIGTVYNRSNLFLKIDGEVLADPALHLSLAYSLDGQEKIPINCQLQPEDHWDPFLGIINCSVPLPPLSSGEHSIIVFGKMGGDFGSTSASVNFTCSSGLSSGA